MIINSTTTSLAKQLFEQELGPKKRDSDAAQLIERAKQADQKDMTPGASDTTLATQEMPKVVKPSVDITPTMQTKTTMDSITQRYKDNFAAMQQAGRNIDINV